jgi:hypothetical protein
MRIVRPAEQVEDLHREAQRVSFQAEDAGREDDYATGVYDTLQWLYGNAERPDLSGL